MVGSWLAAGAGLRGPGAGGAVEGLAMGLGLQDRFVFVLVGSVFLCSWVSSLPLSLSWVSLFVAKLSLFQSFLISS